VGHGFDEWQENHAWTNAPAFAEAGKLVQSLKEYPPRMASVDFNLDEAMKTLTPKGGNSPPELLHQADRRPGQERRYHEGEYLPRPATDETDASLQSAPQR
jgi:hypothetical protein